MNIQEKANKYPLASFPEKWVADYLTHIVKSLIRLDPVKTIFSKNYFKKPVFF